MPHRRHEPLGYSLSGFLWVFSEFRHRGSLSRRKLETTGLAPILFAGVAHSLTRCETSGMKRLVLVLIVISVTAIAPSRSGKGKFGGTFIGVMVAEDSILIGSDSRST